jgi:Rieske Fe-S protein
MSDLNRRDFVAATAVAVACAACACSVAEAADAPPPGGPGGGSGGSGGSGGKAPVNKGKIDLGPKSDYDNVKDGTIIDKWPKPDRVMLIKNGGKIYAVNSTCTHKNCATKLKEADIVCPCHNSKFSVEGTVTKGPAKVSLTRYGISVDDKGHIVADRDKQFEEKKWDDESASLKV